MIRNQPIPRRAGFTIVELLIVLVLIGLLAAMILPKFTSVDRRRTQLGIDQFTDLLTMFAYRDSLRVQRVGFWHDPESDTFQLMINELDPDRPDDPPEWRPDRFSPPIRLPDSVRVVDLRIDGRRWPIDGEWLVNGAVGDFRPRVEIDLSTDEGPVSLILEPDATEPIRVGGGVDDSAYRRSVDLDASGRDREDW